MIFYNSAPVLTLKLLIPCLSGRQTLKDRHRQCRSGHHHREVASCHLNKRPDPRQGEGEGEGQGQGDGEGEGVERMEGASEGYGRGRGSVKAKSEYSSYSVVPRILCSTLLLHALIIVELAVHRTRPPPNPDKLIRAHGCVASSSASGGRGRHRQNPEFLIRPKRKGGRERK